MSQEKVWWLDEKFYDPPEPSWGPDGYELNINRIVAEAEYRGEVKAISDLKKHFESLKEDSDRNWDGRGLELCAQALIVIDAKLAELNKPKE